MVGRKRVAFGPKQSEGKEKEKQIRDKNAPKNPMNAYQRFVTRRLKLSPSKKFGTSREALANFAAEWAAMDKQDKQPYFDEYIAERNEYIAKMDAYKKTPDYKAFQMQKSSAKRRKVTEDPSTSYQRPLHLPPDVKQIFSCEFLDYNKNQEKRMRDVRAQISEVEDQIGLLDRHIASLDDQMRTMQSAMRVDEADTALMRDQMQRWTRIVQESLGMDKNVSLEAVIACAERLTDEQNAGGAETQRAILQQALKKAL